MLKRHAPDKSKHAQLLTEHLAGHMILPYTEEELKQHQKKKAKWEADHILAAEQAAAQRQEHA